VKGTAKKTQGKPKKQRAGTAKRRRCRRKLTLKDRLLLVLVAGVLVAAALAASLVVVFLQSTRPPATSERTVLPAAGLPDSERETETLPERIPPKTETEAPVPPVPAVSLAPAKPEPKTPKHSSGLPPPAPVRETRPGLEKASPGLEKKTSPKTSAPKGPVPATVRPAAAERPPEKPIQGRLVFLIDDAGNNLRELEPFLSFPGPLTVAVLPGLPNSAEAARRIRVAGKEVFLHQPMEALGGQNPGPGAVYAGMSAGEIRSIINKNLDEIWPVAGINNHEGSRVTMDEKAMETILEICRERGILFVDSRTTADTAAPAAARKLGMKIGERDVFLDNSQDRESILGYINTGIRKAEQRGAAIMIGHTWSPELAPLLTGQYNRWLAQGYILSTVSELMGARQ
jgi:polysaccharide deacetylase 2 family uncharacterized protein YibQ